MCRALGVSLGGFYARLRRPPSARAGVDGELSARIAEIHRRSRATYGAPRIHAELKERGIRVGCKRVARLMRAAELKGVSRRNWIITTVRDRAARPAPDLVERNFQRAGAQPPVGRRYNLHPTWAGFLYLAMVLDAFSRKIVGWAMETYLRTELVLKALDLALGQRRAVREAADNSQLLNAVLRQLQFRQTASIHTSSSSRFGPRVLATAVPRSVLFIRGRDMRLRIPFELPNTGRGRQSPLREPCLLRRCGDSSGNVVAGSFLPA